VNSTREKTENSTVSVNTVHWFDASSSVTPMNTPNPHNTYITSTVAGINFCWADSICVALQIS